MTLEDQEAYLNIISEDFINLRQMLDIIERKIAGYPVYTQLAFIKPIKHMIGEAFFDATDENNSFLNNYDGGDKIEIV